MCITLISHLSTASRPVREEGEGHGGGVAAAAGCWVNPGSIGGGEARGECPSSDELHAAMGGGGTAEWACK